jgi:hypothetical protein
MIVFDSGPLPHIMAVCLNEEDYVAHMDKFNLSRTFLPEGGYSHTHFSQVDNKLATVICIDLPRDVHPAAMAGLVVLELNRALKELWDYIGEFKPGIEIEGAYLMEYTKAIMALLIEGVPQSCGGVTSTRN